MKPQHPPSDPTIPSRGSRTSRRAVVTASQAPARLSFKLWTLTLCVHNRARPAEPHGRSDSQHLPSGRSQSTFWGDIVTLRNTIFCEILSVFLSFCVLVFLSCLMIERIKGRQKGAVGTGRTGHVGPVGNGQAGCWHQAL